MRAIHMRTWEAPSVPDFEFGTRVLIQELGRKHKSSYSAGSVRGVRSLGWRPSIGRLVGGVEAEYARHVYGSILEADARQELLEDLVREPLP